MTQKSLLQIVQTAAREISVPIPQNVLSNTNGNVQKLYSYVVAICDELLADFDWQMLQKRYTLTTTNGVDNYAFPTDFDRAISGTVFDQNNRWAMNGSLTPIQWEWSKVSQLSTSPFERYRVFQDKFWLFPVPGATPFTLVYEYISNAYVVDGSSGLQKGLFEADSDICMFDFRTVVYGVIWKYKASVGQDTTDAVSNFNRSYELAKGSDMPTQRLFMGNTRGYKFLGTDNYPDGNWAGQS